MTGLEQVLLRPESVTLVVGQSTTWRGQVGVLQDLEVTSPVREHRVAHLVDDVSQAGKAPYPSLDSPSAACHSSTVVRGSVERNLDPAARDCGFGIDDQVSQSINSHLQVAQDVCNASRQVVGVLLQVVDAALGDVELSAYDVDLVLVHEGTVPMEREGVS